MEKFRYIHSLIDKGIQCIIDKEYALSLDLLHDFFVHFSNMTINIGFSISKVFLDQFNLLENNFNSIESRFVLRQSLKFKDIYNESKNSNEFNINLEADVNKACCSSGSNCSIL